MSSAARCARVLVALALASLVVAPGAAATPSGNWTDVGVYYQGVTVTITGPATIYPPADNGHAVLYFVNGGAVQLAGPAFYSFCSAPDAPAGGCPGAQDTAFVVDPGTSTDVTAYDLGPYTGGGVSYDTSTFAPYAASSPADAAAFTSAPGGGGGGDPVTTTLTGATSHSRAELLVVLGLALGIGAVMLGLRKGWELIRDGGSLPVHRGDDYSHGDQS